MTSSRWLWLGVGLGLGLLGCGRQLVPEVRPPEVRVESTAPEARFPYAEVMARAPAPLAELNGVWLHVRSPTELWRKVPRRARDLPGFTALKALASTSHLPADVAAVVDLSLPVDFVAPLPSWVQATWSFRVRSPEAILRGTAGLTLRRVGPGAWDIGALTGAPEASEETAGDGELEWDGDEDLDEAETRCRLLHLPPPVGFRIVCGPNDRQLAQGAEFLTSPARALDREADVHVELAGPTYDELKGQRLLALALAPSFVSSAGERGVALVLDFAKAFYEHRRATLDLSLQGSTARAELELDYGAELASDRFAEWLTFASRAPPPSSRDALPVDSGLAFTSSGLGATAARYVLSELAASFSGGGPGSASFTEWNAALSGLLPEDGGVSFAYGFDADAASAALDDPARTLADETQRPLSPAVVRRLQAALGGWAVLGVDVAPERFLSAVRRAYRGWPLHLPRGTAEGDSSWSTETKLGAAPPGLPAGTLHFVEQVRAKTQGARADRGSSPLSFDRHYLVVPDGKRVWIALARSESLAAARARLLLGERPGLSWPSFARAGQPAALGTVDLRSLLALGLDWDSREQRADAVAALGRLNRAPQRGAAAVPVRVDVLPTSAPGGGHRLRVQTELEWAELLTQALTLAPPELEEAKSE